MLDEAKRRERAEQQRLQRKLEAMRYEDAVQAQLEDATRVCHGQLIHPRYRDSEDGPHDERMLWRGPEATARRFASWELNAYWDANPRPNFTQWQQAQRDGRRIQRDERDAAQDTTEGATMIDARRETATDQPSLVAKYQAMGARHAVTLREQSAVARRAEPVDGAQTLAYARKFLAHFCIWPSEAALTTAALWAMHAHARDGQGSLVWLSSPRMLFSSAEPGSGKSHAMRLVAKLCPSPAIFTEPSEPALAHSIGKDKAVIGLDEADVYFGQGSRKAAARAIINDGYTPDGEWARVRKGSVERISTFGALMMAGLDKVESGTGGQMAATLSRCIRIRMRRAPEDYRAPRFDHQARFAASLIAERMAAWAKQNLDQLASIVPDVPEGIGNRQAELWEPLLAVADIAGGDWPEMAREACEEMVATGGMPPEDDEKAARLDEIMTSWDAFSYEEE